MAQTDVQSSHVVIDIDAGPSSCAVCTEALEWVAVGPCGHGDVCVHCTARLRFLQGHWRCCICRTYCPTVLVTKADRAARPQAFSRPPPAQGRAGRVDRHYWYLGNMGAYFDDQRQYEAMRKVCIKPPCTTSTTIEDVAMNQSAPSPSQPSHVGVDSDAHPDECPRLGWCLISCAVILTMITMFGLFFTVSENYYQRVVVVLVFGFLSVVLTTLAIMIWRKLKSLAAT